MTKSRYFQRDLDKSLPEDSTGWDIVLEGGDLSYSRSQQLKRVSGVESIISSIHRRLLTVKADYENWIYEQGNWRIIGVNYAGQIPFYQSRSKINLLDMAEDIKEVLDRDQRIEVIKVIPDRIKPDTIEVSIEYRIREESKVRQEKVLI